jgi:subtilase family serine protease
MPKQVKFLSPLFAFLAVCGLGTSALAQAPTSRVAARIDETQVTTLLGNVHPMARGDSDQGVVTAETPLEHLVLQLEPSAGQQAALDTLVEAQHDPHSHLYHQWLTPAEYGSRFGASLQDLSRITGWLTGHGFAVNEIAVNRRQITFSGNAGQVEDTFHTQIHRFLVDGVNHIANTQDPQIPAAMAGVVSGILSLHNFRHVSDIQSRVSLEVRPRYTSGSAHYLFPADWAAIYDLNPLYKAGTNGAGTSIAIVGRSNINLADISSFRSAAGLPPRNPTVILVSTNPGLVAGDQDESTLDVEWSGAIAPSATVKFVVGASTSTTDGIDLSAQYVVNHAIATVMSTSYGSCEVEMGSAELSFYNSLWQQAASEGITSLVSSGDAGVAGCYSGSSSSASSAGVNGLCSSPYSTCVGGTEFNEGSNSTVNWAANNGAGSGSALNYIPEEVWNESAAKGGSGLWASGGGVSLYFSQPAWQRGVSGIGAANGMRAVPDVSVSASAHDGYIIIENGSYYVISGTSAASPSVAGVMALVGQSKGGAGQGNANPSLYALLSASRNPFHATPSGSNNVPGVSGFTASGAAYNLATGLGSVDGSMLVTEWGSGSNTSTPKIDFVLTPSASQGTLLPGKTTTFTLSVTESGAGRNKVSLTATAAPGLTGSISPASITPGTTATVTMTAAPTIASGAKNIVVTGTDITGTQTSTYTLTVVPPPTLSLYAASTSMAVVQSSSGTVGLTAVTGGSFTGMIGYSVSGLPAGVSAKWSANPATPPASISTNNETLTLTASAAAPASVATVVVTVAGDGVSANRSIALQVQPALGVVLGVSPQTLAMTSVSSATVTVTSAPFGGAVLIGSAGWSSMSIASGLPKGITASWGAPGMTSAGILFRTLTLTGSASALAGTSTLSLAGTFTSKTGSVYKSSANLPLTVSLSVAKKLRARPVQNHAKS